MRSILVSAAVAIALGTVSPLAHAQSWQPPAESQRCPSKWGAGDERGSGQPHEARDRAAATRLIKTGEVIELGHVLRPRCRSSAPGASTCSPSARS